MVACYLTSQLSKISDFEVTKEKCDNPLILEGEIRFKEKRFAQAIKTFEQALADKTEISGRERALAYIGMASSYLQSYVEKPAGAALNQKEYFLKAEAYFKDALRSLKRPDILNVSAYSSLGYIYYELGDNAKAVSCLKRVLNYPSINCNKEFVDTYTNLGYVYIRLENF